jgi:hypothetical protein
MVGVFPGAPSPLPSFTLVGNVYSGSDRTAGAIRGATIQVLNGLVAGSLAVTGTAFPCTACCVPSTTPSAGTFILNGVPPGTIRVRVQATGYQVLEQDVTFTFSGGPASVDFQLQPNGGD